MTTIRQFICYWRDNIETVKEGYDTITLLLVGIVLIGVSIFGQLANPIEEAIPKWLGVGSILYCFVVMPFRRHKKLEVELNELKQGKLFIEGVSIEMEKGNRYTCQLRIHNNSYEASAKNVRVEVMKIEPPPESLPNELLHLPLRLFSEKEGKEALIVNPGGELTFDLFAEAIIYQTAFGDNPRYIASVKFSEVDKSTRFEPNKSYLLKVKATATDFPPTEAELSLNFTGEQSKWNLVINNTKQ